MNEDDFDEKLRAASVDALGLKHLAHPVLAEEVPVSALRRGGTSDARTRIITPADHAVRPGIVWVRATDLLSTGTGRIAGRGIDLEAELTRRIPATTRRAIRERADRLPPLSEFGQSREFPPFSRYGLGRR